METSAVIGILKFLYAWPGTPLNLQNPDGLPTQPHPPLPPPPPPAGLHAAGAEALGWYFLLD